MKHLKLFLPLIFGALFLFSCSKDLDNAPEINVLIEENEYTIPIEDALSSLEDFLMETGTVVTKGSINDFIDNYFTVSAPSTKSSGVEENLLYAVNLKGEGGFAILAADSRVREDIIAVTESGSITSSDFEEPTPERIPTDNDDLSISEYNAMVEAGVLANKTLPLGLICKEYARQSKLDYDPQDDGVPPDPYSNGKCSWQTVDVVPRMINTKWSQWHFNDYCPEVGLFNKKKAPSGCVCIALAQIIAYHEYPVIFPCDECTIDYAGMKELYNYDTYKGNVWYFDRNVGELVVGGERKMAARFCKTIGSLCKTKYYSIFGEAYGCAFPKHAKKCLEDLGYKNVSLDHGYDKSRILKALDNGCPVFMAGYPKGSPSEGHAWVIDGYMKRGYVTSKGTFLSPHILVHCNWGWGGNCNGYFSPGIYGSIYTSAGLYDSPYYDGVHVNNMNTRFDGFIRTIIYDNPLFNECGNFSK